MKNEMNLRPFVVETYKLLNTMLKNISRIRCEEDIDEIIECIERFENKWGYVHENCKLNLEVQNERKGLFPRTSRSGSRN